VDGTNIVPDRADVGLPAQIVTVLVSGEVDTREKANPQTKGRGS